MSKISEALAKKKAPAPSSPASKLFRALAGRRVLEPMIVPELELPAAMTLVGTDRLLDIEGEVVIAMAVRRLDAGILFQTQWELERAKRILAEAIREVPEDLAAVDLPPPLGTADEWGRLEPAVIVELQRKYYDLSECHDPSTDELSEDEVAAIRDAIEKKSPVLLRSFGVRKLSHFLLTSAAPPAGSSTETSSPGDSSQES